MYYRKIGFVLLIVCCCEVLAKNVDRSKRAAEGAEHNNCDNVKPFFDMKNVTLPPAGSGKGQLQKKFKNCCVSSQNLRNDFR